MVDGDVEHGNRWDSQEGMQKVKSQKPIVESGQLTIGS
jgi:hypothetical protein